MTRSKRCLSTAMRIKQLWKKGLSPTQIIQQGGFNPKFVRHCCYVFNMYLGVPKVENMAIYNFELFCQKLIEY